MPAIATGDQASGEINAYIAIRDRLLAQAEEAHSEAILDRAASANEFVENCLQPARSPYQAQHLPPAEALRERRRCELITLRLAGLRRTLAHAA
jgi:hypothetical protein